MIEVTYDGSYPTTCMGTLIIKEDGKEIYNEKYCCYSTGAVWFDDNWSEHVEEGRLIWEEDKAAKFSDEVQCAVADKLSRCWVCCGGCV